MSGHSHLSNVDEIIDIFETSYIQNNGVYERDYYYIVANPLTYDELEELYQKRRKLYYEYTSLLFNGHPLDLIRYFSEIVPTSMLEYTTTLVDLISSQALPTPFTTRNGKEDLVFKYKTSIILKGNTPSNANISHIIRCEKESILIEINHFGSVYIQLLEDA